MALGATHWNVKPSVKREANRVSKGRPVEWNTYEDHPPGWGLDEWSVDYWGPGGRGDPIGATVGRQVRAVAKPAKHGLYIRWMIWRGRIWTPSEGWQRYKDPADQHYDHVHITYGR